MEISEKSHANVLRRVKLPQPKNQKLLHSLKYVLSQLILCDYSSVFITVVFEEIFNKFLKQLNLF